MNTDTQKTIRDTQKTIPDTQKTIPDTQLTNPDTQKTIPSTQKTIPDTQLTIPSTHLTIPGTRLTNPGTRPQKIFKNRKTCAFSIAFQLSEKMQSGRRAPAASDSDSNQAIPSAIQAIPPQNHLQQTRAFSFFSDFLAPDRAPGPLQMRRDRRDIPGRVVKVGFGRVFVKKVDFSSKFRPPSATYPFFNPLIHESLSMSASTRFVLCFSFRTRSSNLISLSQSLPNHEFFKNG